jgi:hypothetical protein
VKQLNWLPSILLAVALLGCSASPAVGQGTSGDRQNAKAPFVPHYYHLVFVVKEIEAGKVINSRSYFMTIGTVDGSMNSFNPRSIRTGTKIPTEFEPGKMSYVDVGVNIDCRTVVDLGSRLAMDLSAEVSNVQKEAGDTSKIANPLIQQNKWNSQVVVVLGKPTVVFSSDEVTSKRAIELELTATEIR